LSDEQISVLISFLESDGKFYSVKVFPDGIPKRCNVLLDDAYVVNRRRVSDVNRELAFLLNPIEVSKRKKELSGKISDAKAQRLVAVERHKLLSTTYLQFDGFVKSLNRVQPVEYIFSMFDEELLVRREITCFHNLDMRFVDRLLEDISLLAPNFAVDKYLIITSLADDVDFMSSVKDFNDPVLSERYVSLFKNIRIVTFTQQFPCLLSNLLDLNVITDDDLIKRIRVMIQFSSWLFQQDFSDTRSLAERQSAWIKDQLEKADRVEDAGGSVDSLIGGSKRHKDFRRGF
jgi:hypothetical protein